MVMGDKLELPILGADSQIRITLAAFIIAWTSLSSLLFSISMFVSEYILYGFTSFLKKWCVPVFRMTCAWPAVPIVTAGPYPEVWAKLVLLKSVCITIVVPVV